MSPIGREVLRKLFHLTELFVILGYSFLHFYFSPKLGILALTALLLLLLEIEYIRIDYQTKIGNQITEFFLRFILRNHEKNNLTGAIFFVLSTIIAFSAFDYPIAVTALTFTVIGDLVSAIMGTWLGKGKIFRNKSYVGTFSGLVANLIVGQILMGSHPEVFVPMAFMASIVETLTQKLDDNLTVPLFAGFTGQCIVFFGGILLTQTLFI